VYLHTENFIFQLKDSDGEFSVALFTSRQPTYVKGKTFFKLCSLAKSCQHFVSFFSLNKLDLLEDFVLLFLLFVSVPVSSLHDTQQFLSSTVPFNFFTVFSDCSCSLFLKYIRII